MKQLPAHLGGHAYITHTDPAAIRFLKSRFNIKTAVDLGCGPGGMVKVIGDEGITCIGVDGDHTLTDVWKNSKIEVVVHDFSLGPMTLENEFDLLWSTEFLEHVDEKYIPNYFEVIQQAKFVFCTASNSPKGHHHVNVKPTSWWVKTFADWNFELLGEETATVREISTMARDFVRDTGMVFQNKMR